MTTLDRLDRWKASGVIGADQHALLRSLVRQDRFSLFVEINALLYLGVLSAVGGLAWTARAYVLNLGDGVILSVLGLLTAVSFYYCFSRAVPYDNDEVESPSIGVRLRAVLRLPRAVGDTRLHRDAFCDLPGLDDAPVHRVGGVRAAGVPVRQPVRVVAGDLDTGWISRPQDRRVRSRRYRHPAVHRAGVRHVRSIGLGVWLHRQRVKPHFLETYIHIGANVVMMATASGVLEPGIGWLYLAALLSLSAAAIYLGIRFNRFAFVAYGTLYGYGSVSARLLDSIGGPTVGALVFPADRHDDRDRSRRPGEAVWTGRMSAYSDDQERAIRVQRLVNDWTKSGLLTPEQRDQIAPELQVELRRTNKFPARHDVRVRVHDPAVVHRITGAGVRRFGRDRAWCSARSSLAAASRWPTCS